MQINLVSKNIELTDEIRDYALKRVTNLEKFLASFTEESEPIATMEVSKSTNHHRAGEVFHADCSVMVKGEKFYAESDNEDIHAAIDDVKEKLFNAITKTVERNQTLYRRGAASVKKMLKGLSDRNPFTSKYE